MLKTLKKQSPAIREWLDNAGAVTWRVAVRIGKIALTAGVALGILTLFARTTRAVFDQAAEAGITYAYGYRSTPEFRAQQIAEQRAYLARAGENRITLVDQNSNQPLQQFQTALHFQTHMAMPARAESLGDVGYALTLLTTPLSWIGVVDKTWGHAFDDGYALALSRVPGQDGGRCLLSTASDELSGPMLAGRSFASYRTEPENLHALVNEPLFRRYVFLHEYTHCIDGMDVSRWQESPMLDDISEMRRTAVLETTADIGSFMLLLRDAQTEEERNAVLALADRMLQLRALRSDPTHDTAFGLQLFLEEYRAGLIHIAGPDQGLVHLAKNYADRALPAQHSYGHYLDGLSWLSYAVNHRRFDPASEDTQYIRERLQADENLRRRFALAAQAYNSLTGDVVPSTALLGLTPPAVDTLTPEVNLGRTIRDTLVPEHVGGTDVR